MFAVGKLLKTNYDIPQGHSLYLLYSMMRSLPSYIAPEIKSDTADVQTKEAIYFSGSFLHGLLGIESGNLQTSSNHLQRWIFSYFFLFLYFIFYDSVCKFCSCSMTFG